MNQPPEEFIRVSHADLEQFVSTAAQTVGLPKEKADLLGELLAGNDLRGTFSHGTQQIATYAILMRDGILNNDPQLEILKETPVSLMVDGDGGLGYFPAYEGTRRVIEKAKTTGIAVMSSRNHGHFGAAGIYSRMGLNHDLLTFVTSGHQLNLSPGNPIFSAAGGSPMSFSVPTDDQAPMVLDFGAMHDFYSGAPCRDKIVRMAPGVVLRSIGLGSICQTWGGLLAGLPMDVSRITKDFEGANQGSLVVTFKIELFLDPEQFKKEMDEYVRRVVELEPMEGFDTSRLPGGPEVEREEAYRREGIPVGKGHQERFEKLAEELGVDVPW